jgi:ribosomal protein S27E
MSRERTSPIWKMTSDEFRSLILGSETYTEILGHWGLRNKGNNHRTLKRRIEEEKIDTSHLKKNFDRMVQKNLRNVIPLDQVMVENSDYCSQSLKRRMLREGLLIDRCSICGHEPEWNGKSLVLVLDHVNGKSNDHRKENLRLLCPNCNSQQDTFAGRNNKKNSRHCKTCGEVIYRHNKSGLCMRCMPRKRKVGNRPDKDDMKEKAGKIGFEAVGRIYGVSGNTIRKWIGV